MIEPNRPVHRNVRIENNTFKTFDYPVLYAKSTSDLLFKGNRIIRTTELQPSSGNKNTFLLNGCDRVVIEGTSFEGEVLGRNLRIENMKKKNVCYSKDIMFEK